MKTIKRLFLFATFGVVALISGVMLTSSKRIESAPITGEIEYSIPHISSGNMQLQHANRIFRMMPYDVQVKAILAFRDIIRMDSQCFYYGGVLVKHPSESIWSFHYNGATIVVKATPAALSTFFQEAPTI